MLFYINIRIYVTQNNINVKGNKAMGNISIMARRFSDGHVQYGWSGNGGYFSFTGAHLLQWYQNSDAVEYLFGLGQTACVGRVGSENGGCSIMETNAPTGRPFWLGNTEREIFSKINWIDYGYFYDLIINGIILFRDRFVLSCLWN